MPVASISANADGRSSAGDITRAGSGLLVTVDGSRVGPPAGSLRAAAERLAQAIGGKLPGNPASWGVAAQCPEHGLNVVVGNLAHGQGGGELHPCAARVLRDRPLPTLEAALAAFTQVIGSCCS